MNRTAGSIRASRSRGGSLAALALVLGACVFVPRASATYPGHNGLIAFGAQTGDHSQIYTIRPNGHDLHQLTHVDGDANSPDWSPDGRRIVFGIDYSDRAAVVIMNADGSDMTEIPDASGILEGGPSFTPDGRRIVFVRFDGTVERMWSMDLHGGHRKQLPFGGDGPTVSPDGRALTFVEETDTGKALWQTNLDGGDLQQLLPPEFDNSVKFDWAPDGKHLLVGGNANHFMDPGGSANIATIRPDGSGLRYLTNYHDPAVNVLPGTYSPDGRYIVFRLEDHGSSALMEMRPDGSHWKTIHDFGDFTASGFKPRGIDWGPRPQGNAR